MVSHRKRAIHENTCRVLHKILTRLHHQSVSLTRAELRRQYSQHDDVSAVQLHGIIQVELEALLARHQRAVEDSDGVGTADEDLLGDEDTEVEQVQPTPVRHGEVTLLGANLRQVKLCTVTTCRDIRYSQSMCKNPT